MSYSALWAKTTLTKTLVKDDFDKYGQLLKWKGCKETVLEVGSADGSITRDILYKRYGDRMKKLVAIDKLDGMTEYAKTLNKCGNIDFVTMDIMNQRKIEEMKNYFDRIFSFYSLHWIPDNGTLMKNFYEVLKSNGQIFFTTMLNTPFHESFRRLSKYCVWAKYVPVEEVHSEYTDNPVKYVSKIVEDAGFKVDLCKRTQGFDVVKDMPDFVKAACAMYQYINYIPKELQDEFLQYHTKFCCENSIYVGEPNAYRITYDALICIGSKNM